MLAELASPPFGSGRSDRDRPSWVELGRAPAPEGTLVTGLRWPFSSRPPAWQWPPTFQVRQLCLDDVHVRLEDDVMQKARARNAVHAERPRLAFVDVAREHVPDGRLDQQPMRLDSSNRLPALSKARNMQTA